MHWIVQAERENTNPLDYDEIKPPLIPLVILTKEQVDKESSEMLDPYTKPPS